MATLTSLSGAATAPVPGLPIPSGVLGVAWGYYAITAEPSPADDLRICRLPKGATVIGGFVQAADLDTNGSETIDFDLGWEGNGVDALDVDGFGNFGVQTGDVSVHLPVAGIWMPLANIIQNPGYKTFAAETIVTITWVDDPATLTAGAIKAVIWYV